MNKNIIYSILLVLVIGGAFFYQYQESKFPVKDSQTYVYLPKIQDGNYLDGFFFEKYYNDQQPLHPFVALKAGSEFLFHFSLSDSTLFYRITEDSPADRATLRAEILELNIKIENDHNCDQLIEAQRLSKIIGKGLPKIISKQAITETVHSADIKMASIIDKVPIHNRGVVGFIGSPISELLSLLFCVIIIWWIRLFSGFFGGLMGMSEEPILSIFVFALLVLLPFSAFSQYLVALEPSVGNMWDVFLSTYGLYKLVPVGLFFVFRYLINIYKAKYDFADLELAKFVFVVVGWKLFLALDSSILTFSFSEYKDQLSGFNNSLTSWSEALLFATANFLNNFRAHYYQLRRKGKNLKIAVAKVQTSQSELEALHSRVNPHFLYNSLNSIASLASTNPVKTEKMAMALSNFYKYNTNRQDEIWTTIGEEMEMINTYLDIEKIRFEDQLEIQIKVNEDCRNYKIPRFIIQPLVENAIKYGYDKSTGKIKIDILVDYKLKDQKLDITIQDGGVPFTEDLDAGYGFNSVQKKLKIAFPDNHHFGFINSPQKSVNITINNPGIYA